MSFLAVCGIGLAALFTDLVAVRLRKAAAAGVPLLALFSATVASKASAPTIDEAAIFSAGVAGYLALLVAEGRERLQAWGRLVPVQPGMTRMITTRQHTAERVLPGEHQVHIEQQAERGNRQADDGGKRPDPGQRRYAGHHDYGAYALPEPC